jgi:hypothetical protein
VKTQLFSGSSARLYGIDAKAEVPRLSVDKYAQSS